MNVCVCLKKKEEKEEKMNYLTNPNSREEKLEISNFAKIYYKNLC